MQKNDPYWMKFIAAQHGEAYYDSLMCFMQEEFDLYDKEYNKWPVCPARHQIWNAFRKTAFEDTKVVILGQDPYHTPGVAHGLAFSSLDGVPPSLRNIYKEIESDLGISMPKDNGDLTPWAEQGVLLLNNVLTVRSGKPRSHRRKGWEEFTDRVVRRVSYRGGAVFILWGKDAQSKEVLIDPNKNLILKATHPSPLSAHRGFFGCRHFSKANEWLRAQGRKEIDWGID